MLELQQISKTFDIFTLKQIDLTVNKGDYFVLLGKSGAGKSVLLEIIAGLMPPDSGKVFLNQKEITFEKIQKRNIGIVFQDYALFPHLTAFQNISYALKIKNDYSGQIEDVVNQMADEMNILHLLNKKPGELSGGECQRVALARTLAVKPDILLLDEPISALDVQIKNGVRSLLRKINRAGQTIIHVTHDYEDAISLANRVAVMNDGTIIQQGDVHEVFQYPKSSFVADFVGIRNFFEAEITSNSDNYKTASINNKIKIDFISEENINKGFILIDAENITLFNCKPDSSARNNFQGTISQIITTRYGYEVFVDIGIQISALITSKSKEHLNLQEGNSVWVSFKAGAIKLIG